MVTWKGCLAPRFLSGNKGTKHSTYRGLMTSLDDAARVIEAADALLITAGAGMGVDSGLPDFRGGQGFWNAYPPYRALKIDFLEISSPDWFRKDPAFAWGFYGHRRNLYRETQPHNGYHLLREWAGKKKNGYFVVASNVDGAFKKAGFEEDRIVEAHGSIEWNQCLSICGAGITPAGPETVEIDTDQMRAVSQIPTCPGCSGTTRPNIMMFGDPYWDKRRTEAQLERFYAWLTGVRKKNVVVIECGAGIEIPSIRERSEEVIEEVGGKLVRINPAHARAPTGQIGLEMGALEALSKINLAHSSM